MSERNEPCWAINFPNVFRWRALWAINCMPRSAAPISLMQWCNLPGPSLPYKNINSIETKHLCCKFTMVKPTTNPERKFIRPHLELELTSFNTYILEDECSLLFLEKNSTWVLNLKQKLKKKTEKVQDPDNQVDATNFKRTDHYMEHCGREWKLKTEYVWQSVIPSITWEATWQLYLGNLKPTSFS